MKIDASELREIAQAAELITSRIDVAISMIRAEQETLVKTNIEQAIEACRNTKKRLEDFKREAGI